MIYVLRKTLFVERFFVAHNDKTGANDMFDISMRDNSWPSFRLRFIRVGD